MTKPMVSDEQDWDYWLSELRDKGVNLSASEEDFREQADVTRRLGQRLTQKQGETLQRIFLARTP